MKQRAILFSTDMVKAIPGGRKTQTRRTSKLDQINEAPNEFRYDGLDEDDETVHWFELIEEDGTPKEIYAQAKCPYGKPGDILWVRETWQETIWIHPSNEEYGYIYRASDNGNEWETNTENFKWKPSIHMPKKACRLFLEILSIRVERLHEITEQDAIAEGIEVIHMAEDKLPVYRNYLLKEKLGTLNPVKSFRTLWQSINGKESWNLNTWVWVIEFKQVPKSE